MDHFGIGAAMKAMAYTYFQCARRTGSHNITGRKCKGR